MALQSIDNYSYSLQWIHLSSFVRIRKKEGEVGFTINPMYPRIHSVFKGTKWFYAEAGPGDQSIKTIDFRKKDQKENDCCFFITNIPSEYKQQRSHELCIFRIRNMCKPM